MRIKLIQSNQSEMVSYFHENLNKRIGAVAQTVYTDVYNCLGRRLRCDSDVYISVTAMTADSAVTAVKTDSAVTAVAADSAVTAMCILV